MLVIVHYDVTSDASNNTLLCNQGMMLVIVPYDVTSDASNST